MRLSPPSRSSPSQLLLPSPLLLACILLLLLLLSSHDLRTVRAFVLPETGGATGSGVAPRRRLRHRSRLASWGMLPELPKLPKLPIDLPKLPDLSSLLGENAAAVGGGASTADAMPAAASSAAAVDEVVVEDLPVELTEVEIELLARHLKTTIDIPYIPEFMEGEVLRVAITTVCKIAPVALPDGMFLELMKGNCDWSSVQEDVIGTLNDKICIPIVPRNVQDELVKGVCLILFNPMTDDPKHRRKMIGRSLQATFNADSDEDFAKMLNEMVDLPFLNEEQEYKMALQLAKKINVAFETLVPESMRELLKENSSPEELQEARINLVDRLNDMIDIPLQTEEQEEVQFKRIVDFLLMRYGLSEGTKLPHEELVYISKELAVLEEELEIQIALHEGKKEKLSSKMTALADRRMILEADGHCVDDGDDDAGGDENDEQDEQPAVPFFAA